MISQLLVMTMLFSGCAKNVSLENKEIHFAVTGEKALYDYDESFMNGVQMAIEDCNGQYAGEGFQISMEFYDDEGVYEKGIVISHGIAEDHRVTAVLGSQSFYITNSAAEIFENAGKILITPYSANDETLEEGYQYLFRNTHSANDVGVALAKYAVEKGYRRVAVCSRGSEYEAAVVRGFCRESRDSGLKIADYFTKANTQDELDGVFERWELLEVNCVVIVQYSEADAFDLLKAIRSKYPTMPILGDMAFDIKELLAKYREFSDHIVIAGPLNIEPGEKNRIFKNRYLERYRTQPTDYAIQGYDSIKMTVDTAVRLNSTDPAMIAAELHRKGYDGISGAIRFDEKGRLVSGLPELLISQDGVFRRGDDE
ncbi:MAG: ABC transporter substrate-binding protein [Dehalobacterium sp.]